MHAYKTLERKATFKRWDTTALCKFYGMLVLITLQNSLPGASGRCPQCGCMEFREAPYGWTECAGDCGFAVLTAHLTRGRK